MNRYANLLRETWAVPVVGALGFVAGAAVGFTFTRRQYNKLERDLAVVEKNTVDLEELTTQFNFAMVEKDQQFQLALQQAAKVTRDLTDQGEILLGALRMINVQEPEAMEASVHRHPSAAIEEPENDGVVVNIFDQAGDEWDYKTELETRTKDAPYVIHVDEYVADENEWDSQSTLTYYEADDILTDSYDTPIYNYREMVGELRFGHGSLDPNVVHVRNESLQAEYEIIRDPGSYEMIVLGEQEELKQKRRDLKHSHLLKFRDD